MAARLLVALALLLAEGPSFAARPAQQADATTALVMRLEDAANAGNVTAIAALGTAEGDGTTLDDFARMMTPTPTRVVIKERDRTQMRDGSARVLLEVFVQRGIEGRVGTWRADVRAPDAGKPGDGAALRVVHMDRLAVVTGLYRLTLDTSQQFDVRDLTVTGQDLAIKVASGSAFVAHTPDGTTAIVLMGRGRFVFSPPDEAERTQVRIFSGEDAVNAEFDCALVRVRPSDFASYFTTTALVPRAVAPAELRRAQEFFEDTIGRALQIDLTDLSRERWSLVPVSGDMIAEFRTKRFGNLTYTRVGDDAEDVSLFDRKRRKNISVYASSEKLASRGRFYSEDDLVDYDVLSYDLEAAFSPERLWIDGLAKLVVRVSAPVATTLTLRLADSLTVRGVYSRRVRPPPPPARRRPEQHHHQPAGPTTRNTELALQVLYSGRLEPQSLDREAIALQDQEQFVLQAEPHYVYSNRSYWYPQSTVTDYATASCASRCRRISTSSPAAAQQGRRRRRPGRSQSGDRAAQAVRLRRGAAGAVSRLRDQPVQHGDQRGAARSGVGRHGTRQRRTAARSTGGTGARPWRLVDRASEPAAGRAGARYRRPFGGDLRVLRVAHRRCAVPELHARA